jgi:(1->4)-alpha-D-glucan 1-alpha-D-glucosylmutase
VQFTAPGIPDLYQGDELWNFAVVDPDNRRPVDFRRRLRLTAGAMPSAQRLASTLEDGRLKLAVVRAALAVRRRAPRLFAEGSYLPLRIEGPAANHVFAFARTLDRQAVVTIVPRLLRTLNDDPEKIPVGPVWRSTRVRLPGRVASGAFRDSLTGRPVEPGGETATLDLEGVLDRLPLALLVR